MKTRYWIIICIACLLLGGSSWAVIDHYAFPCPTAKDFAVEAGPEHEATPNPGVTDPYRCGKTIHIDGTREDSRTLRVKVWTDYLTNYRDFYLDFTCPYIPKWTLQLGALGGIGYQPDTNRADPLLGAEADLYRHFKAFAIGGGIWYMQSMTTNYKAGGIKASFLFSWGRQ